MKTLSIAEISKLISDRTEDLLEWISESDSTTDPRGHYVEFESFDCKPYKPVHLAEIVSLGLATAHPESDYFPTLEDYNQSVEFGSEEECGGSAFLTITDLGMEYLKENGLL